MAHIPCCYGCGVSSNFTPSLGTSKCNGFSPKQEKKKKKLTLYVLVWGRNLSLLHWSTWSFLCWYYTILILITETLKGIANKKYKFTSFMYLSWHCHINSRVSLSIFTRAGRFWTNRLIYFSWYRAFLVFRFLGQFLKCMHYKEFVYFTNTSDSSDQ